MNAARVRNEYQKSEAQAETHPVKLIHLMYERVLTHLELAEQGVLQKDVKLRGENLSKAIAIISELNAAIKKDDKTETADFLRGLYSAILVELPKIGISQNVEIVRQSIRYIQKLKSIWEETAMKEAGFSKAANGEVAKTRKGPINEYPQYSAGEVSEKKTYSAKNRGEAAKPKAEGILSAVSVSI
jgi:flagellar protein FliS